MHAMSLIFVSKKNQNKLHYLLTGLKQGHYAWIAVHRYITSIGLVQANLRPKLNKFAARNPVLV